MASPEGLELTTPTLMRAARGAYARSIRAALHEIGVDDLPRNGAFILAGIDSMGGPRTDLPSDLGVTKQAVSLVIDALVNRGYLTRTTDPGDRRRISLELTESGREVVAAVLRGIDAVDVRLRERATAEQIEAMRTVLAILADIKTADTEAGVGRSRPAALLRRFAPIFPVRNLAAALAHYASLGFEVSAYEDGDGYGFVSRDGVGLHLTAEHHHGDDHHGDDHQHKHEGGRAYLYVRDADALYEQWNKPGLRGQTWPAEVKPWKVREGSHIDPDGNVIRFGSFIHE
ncbi:MAG TPA: MarR family transcriptional regulator [Streptosporangiaceae bacterium]|nr:MarR family transcriptional regulator [Streptosporangiaceae bacterium]